MKKRRRRRRGRGKDNCFQSSFGWEINLEDVLSGSGIREVRDPGGVFGTFHNPTEMGGGPQMICPKTLITEEEAKRALKWIKEGKKRVSFSWEGKPGGKER